MLLPAWLVRVLRASPGTESAPPASPTTEPEDAAAGDWWPPARQPSPVTWAYPGPGGLKELPPPPDGATIVSFDEDGWPELAAHGHIEPRY